MKSNNKSKDYERLTQEVYSELLKVQGFPDINVQHNICITGKSGVKHQVDVFWEFKQAGALHKTIIECKTIRIESR
jgi:hypothetical protein